MRCLFILILFLLYSFSGFSDDKCKEAINELLNASNQFEVKQYENNRYIEASYIVDGQNKLIAVSTQDDLVKDRDLKDLMKTYLSLNISLLDDFEIPNQLMIILSKHLTTSVVSSKSPHYNPIRSSVNVPVQFLKSGFHKWYAKHPKFSKPIQVHEIAHAIIDASFQKTLEPWAKFKQTQKDWASIGAQKNQLNQELISIVNKYQSAESKKIIEDLFEKRATITGEKADLEIKIWKKNLDESKHKESLKRFDQKITRLNEKIYNARLYSITDENDKKRWVEIIEELKPINELYNQYMEILQADINSQLFTAYDEFLADTITVTYLNDPKSISKSIEFSNSKKEKISRDFENKLPLSVLPDVVQTDGVKKVFTSFDLSNGVIYQKDVVTEWGRNKFYEAHEILNATRGHVWKYYLSNPLYSKKKSQVLGLIAKAVAIEIQARVAEPELIGQFLSPRQMNKRLIETIDRVIKEAQI